MSFEPLIVEEQQRSISWARIENQSVVAYGERVDRLSTIMVRASGKL